LALLLEALERAGRDYQAVAQIRNIDATMPSGFPPKRMLRLTDRDAVLARSGLTHGECATGAFAATAVLEVGAGSIRLTRGWISIEVDVDGTPVLVVSTHLETSQYPDVQLEQAREMTAGVLDTDRPVVLIGDLNAQAPAAPAYRM